MVPVRPVVESLSVALIQSHKKQAQQALLTPDSQPSPGCWHCKQIESPRPFESLRAGKRTAYSFRPLYPNVSTVLWRLCLPAFLQLSILLETTVSNLFVPTYAYCSPFLSSVCSFGTL
ncbi:hypothetical protein SAY86_003429 [Trapa natans]|uniref:Uncharacterized protein n=1 Tax=Trapa natans TaxID=22666 RepID=A0AAN7RGW8_TRANT|nr:hypothetical protein SAY86_003429 [Trapa natans]